jgi:putative transposase
MNDDPPGRKHPIHQSVYERFNTPIIIFVTVCTKDRKAVLANAEMHEILRDSWQRAERWMVGRYVIMPDHIHLFCTPVVLVPESLQAWIGFWKAAVTRAWPHRAALPVWQRHFWDTQLRRGENYDAKWDYVLNNPVRAGLVVKPQDWPYQGEINVLTW